jgi:hypothetical protein
MDPSAKLKTRQLQTVLDRHVDLIKQRNWITLVHIWFTVAVVVLIYLLSGDAYFLSPSAAVVGILGVIKQINNTDKIQKFAGIKSGSLLPNPLKMFKKPKDKRRATILRVIIDTLAGDTDDTSSIRSLSPPSTPSQVPPEVV